MRKEIKVNLKEKKHKCSCKKEELEEKVLNEEEELINKLNTTILELENRLKLLQADSINYRKRKDEEVMQRLKYANEGLILKIVKIKNIFNDAFKMVDNAEFEKYSKGFLMIYNELDSTLKEFGVTKIECLGEKFNYKEEEALFVGKDETKEDDVVLEVLREGYKLHDKVILPAQVKVNKLDDQK